ncbi:hypothetical protein Pmar_PMAR026685 [Perkinsus marinus ATCC 50983]|uniref:Uncharacterized protein n=1 Tax=Perkinsus marinus (strain ATCC 50983 / TXsc) TaxID=423536 RepID=C5LWB9_PERM5|nr:hypothetical protein Pmar_PMAR026685 [Perkinsus marinus ATCC 50983]EEQ98961.1 hypothetical protein Pmar_PMAR026685 [Perkinsus marinus ATCC 50983]|eukprot:XP_002766244.1 hypothetical protein Pmar_PMAR026685 [Perkinsus marinus ATCC 50983]
MSDKITSLLDDLWTSLNATALDGGRIEIPSVLLSGGPATIIEAIEWRVDWPVKKLHY